MRAALPRELTDAVTIVSGMSVLFGVLGWLGWLIGRGVFGRDIVVERWVIHGGGVGGVLGLLLSAWYLMR